MKQGLPKHILIDESPGETRVAVLKEGKLSDVFVERQHRPALKGSLILGKVQAVKKELNAVFLDLGGITGYLEGIPKPSPIEGGALLVEVLSEPIDKKGARVTANFSLLGSMADITPNQTGYSISRDIKAKGRRALIRDLLSNVIPKDIGVFIKSNANKCELAELEEELRTLLVDWESMQLDIARGEQPKIVKPAYSLMELRGDWKKNAIICEGKDGILFKKFNIDAQISRALESVVETQTGVVLTIEEMEALTAIDIDLASHKTAQSHPLKLAEVLAEEIFRQIRLRKLSGIILIDYPRAKNLGARDHFHSEIKRIASQDEYKLVVHGWTRTGLLELTKDRLGPSLRDMFLCKNSASQLLIEVIAIEACRALITGSDGIAIPQLVCSQALKSALLGPLRKTFDEVKRRLGVDVDFNVDLYLTHDEFYIQAKKITQL
ncbi:ribonuclease E/G [Alphaproteobacteria bacterium]|nr:ribonuclease E/G [Alphaproteobacteria bacterium]